jgi:predicted small secreted protein
VQSSRFAEELGKTVVVIGIGLVACNTVRGVGKDIEAGGEAIQKATK